MNMEIRNMLVGTTAHLPSAQPDGIDNFVVAEYDAGWLFWVPSADYGFQPASSELRNLFDVARRHGCSYLLLDRDADPVPGCTVYEW